jgi:hypothetical protein
MTKIDSLITTKIEIKDEYTLPLADGTVGQVIKTDGAGVLIFADDVAGTDEKVKYDAADPTAGYIADKIIAGAGISVAEGVGGDENKLVITNEDKGSDVDLSGFVEKATLTTKGDIYVATGAGVPVRFEVGADGEMIIADSTETTGLKWVNVTAGFKIVVSGGGTNKIGTALAGASAGDVVIVDAGVYVEENNIAKNGVRTHYMAGAIVQKTTAGALYDISGFTSDVVITGDAVFETTNQLMLISSLMSANIHIEYLSATSTATNLISIPTQNTFSGNLYVNGKYKSLSSGGSCVFVERQDSGATLGVKIEGGKYESTTAYGIYISQLVRRRTIVINIEEAITAHSTNQALYVGGYAVASGVCNISVRAGRIQGTNALYTYLQMVDDSSRLDINVDAHIIGNVSINSFTAFKRISHNFYGSIRNGTITINTTEADKRFEPVVFYAALTACTITSGGTGSVIFNGALNSCTLNLNHNAVWTLNGMLERYTSGSLGTFTAGTLINNNRMVNIGTNSNLSTNIVWDFTINGTKLINNGIIESQLITFTGTPSRLPLITFLSGTIINTKVIKNVTASALSQGINVTGDSTYVHDGGRIITSGGASINNAAHTLTIKNYNQYFTNVARNNGGRTPATLGFLETIVGGGSEVVDTDVTE